MTDKELERIREHFPILDREIQETGIDKKSYLAVCMLELVRAIQRIAEIVTALLLVKMISG